MKSRIAMIISTILMLAVSQAPAQCPDCSGGLRTGDDITAQGLIAPTVALTEVYRTSIVGGYVAAGVGLRSSASGNITISLPAGATIEKAFLYWAIMQNSESPSAELDDVTFNANPVVGTLIGTAGDPCWIPQYIHNYVADVTTLAVNGINSVALADIADILREGASLIVIFEDPAGSPKEVIIQHGAVTFAGSPAESVTFSGFSDLVKSTAKTTFIVADGQSNASCTTISDESSVIDTCALRGDDTVGEYWDTDTYAVTDASDDNITLEILSGTDCLTWVAQVLSVDFCTWTEETAWAVGSRYVDKGNWAMYVEYSGATTVELRADGGDGIGMVAGSVEFSAVSGDEVTITITLNEDWRFQDVDGNVKIQDYESAPPAKNPKPGQFDSKGDADPEDDSFEIIVPANNFYGVHVQVEWVDCNEE